MSVWTSTYDKILNSISFLYQRASAKEQVSFQERQIIGDAVNEALVQVLVSRGVDRWNFNLSHQTATLTGGSREVTLPQGTLSVLSGTVRIPSEKITLYPTNLECVLGSDPSNEVDGIPIFYAFDSTTDPNNPKLLVAPVPNRDFDLSFSVERLTDKDATSSFPVYLHGPVTDLATAIAMRRLGFGNPSLYEAAYRDGEMNANNKLGDDGPMHIQKANLTPPQPGIQHRIQG